MKRLFPIFICVLALVFAAPAAFATLTPPPAASGGELIVDDEDPGYSDTGWTESGVSAGYNSDYYYMTAGDGSETATWAPEVIHPGYYNVYVSWTTHSNRATSSPYAVNYDGGTYNFTVNQELLADQTTAPAGIEWSDWFYAGTFPFAAGDSGTVVLSNDADEHVIADAVMFEPVAAEIHGAKFDDINGNGALDEGEPGIEGWKIKLKNLDTNEVTNVFTDESGLYSFTGLSAGEYRISEKQVEGWVQTMPTDPNKYTLSLNPGDVAIGADFGNFKRAEIHGVKYEDVNGNAFMDPGEPTLPGWEITIDGPEGTATTTTDANGEYWFTDLPPGDHIITEEEEAGWGQSQPGPLNGFAHVVTPTSGGIHEGVNFGNYRFAAIKGRKYHDKNLNGTRNAGEPWLPGWTIKLYHLQTGQTYQDTTNGTGRYAFTDLAPGKYLVQEILQSGWVPVNPKSSVHSVTILSDQTIQGLHFGNATVQDIALDAIFGAFGGGGATPLSTSGFRNLRTEPLVSTPQNDPEEDPVEIIEEPAPTILEEPEEPVVPLGAPTPVPPGPGPLSPEFKNDLLKTSLETTKKVQKGISALHKKLRKSHTEFKFRK